MAVGTSLRLYSLFQEMGAIACAYAGTLLVLSRRAVHRTRKTYETPSFLDHYLTLLHLFQY